MVNSKVIVGIVGISVIGIILFGISGVETSNNEKSTSSPNDEILTSPSNDGAVAISDSVTLEKNTIDSENNPSYTVDDDGIKRYTISAVDTPEIGD